MQQELKTHIAKIEAKLLRHESTDTFTFEFVSDLVQSFKDIVEKPIDTTKDVFEIRHEWSTALGRMRYYGYKNDIFISISSETQDDAIALLDNYINGMDTKNVNVVYKKEVANG